MTTWEHLSEVPPEVITTMKKVSAQWEKQDLGIEAVVDMAIQAPNVTKMVGRIVRYSANSVRIPALVQVLIMAHPNLSKRNVFIAIAIFTGLHRKHVQRLHYNERKTHV